MNFVNRIVNFFSARTYLRYLILLVASLGLFSYLHWDKTFADPDSFYHAKMAIQLTEYGAITQFPWLSATNLKYSFTDHHFLYHLALIPFVKFFPPLVGLKVATVILASLAILAIYFFLRYLRIKGAFWYAFFLLSVNPFIFRLSLAKAQQLVIIFLFLIIYLIFTRRYLSLAFASTLYVWLYAGWPLAIILVGVYATVNFFCQLRRRGWWKISQKSLKIYQQDLLLLFSGCVGVLSGLFFSPYFAGNLKFYWEQSFKIAVVNYQYIIGVGAEWYPYELSSLLLAAPLFFGLLLLAVVSFVVNFKRQETGSWFFFVLSLLFFILTLKSRRYVEYFIPLALCFSAISLNYWVGAVKEFLTKHFSRLSPPLLPLILFIALSPVFYRDLASIKNFYQNAFPFDKFASASLWLKDYARPGEIVFHSDWDEFPILFYHNDRNYYLVGLDPTFMYEYDKDLYKIWVEITTGQSDKDLHKKISVLFNASYVFIDLKENAAFNDNIKNNFLFYKIFADSEAVIYRVIN